MRKPRNLEIVWEKEKWPPGISPIEKFRIVGMHNNLSVTHLDWMSSACKALRSVFVATEDILQLDFLPYFFKTHIHSGALRTMQIAVVGLWHYEVVIESVREEDTHLKHLADELKNLLIHVTGNPGAEAETWSDSGYLRVKEMRELTKDEKEAYSDRLSTRS